MEKQARVIPAFLELHLLALFSRCRRQPPYEEIDFMPAAPTCPRDVIFMGTARCNCYAGCGLLSLMFAIGRKGIIKAGAQKCLQIDGDSRGLGSVSRIRAIRKLVGTTIFSNGVCRSQCLWLNSLLPLQRYFACPPWISHHSHLKKD